MSDLNYKKITIKLKSKNPETKKSILNQKEKAEEKKSNKNYMNNAINIKKISNLEIQKNLNCYKPGIEESVLNIWLCSKNQNNVTTIEYSFDPKNKKITKKDNSFLFQKKKYKNNYKREMTPEIDNGKKLISKKKIFLKYI